MLPALTKPGIDPVQTHLVQEFKHNSPLIGCRIDPSGRFVFAGAEDNTIQRWELATGKRTALVGHNSWVRALAAEPADHLLFSGDYAGRILAWSIHAEAPKPIVLGHRPALGPELGRGLQTAPEPASPELGRGLQTSPEQPAHRGWVRAVAISGDGSLLASAGNDHLVKLWSCPEGKLLRALEGHDCHVYNVAFHPNGQEIVSADLKGVVKHWTVNTGKAVRDLGAAALYKYDTGFRANIGGIRSMAFDAAGALLACAGITEVTNAFAGVGKPLVVLFDWLTGKRRQALIPKEGFQGTAWGVAFHPLGFIVGAGGGSGGALWFWKPDQAQAFHTVKLPTNARDVSLHPDGERLAVPFADGAVRVYRMAAKQGK